MSRIEIPFDFALENGRAVRVLGYADAYVSLDDPKSRGIHMSRLFLILQQGLAKGPIDVSSLRNILQDFLTSHQGLSHQAFLDIKFELPLMRQALITKNEAWRTYPIQLEAQLDRNQFNCSVEVVVKYSSTCPCSAALARQV